MSGGPRRVRRATLGTLVSGVASQAVLIVSGVLVARLLGPEDRGYLALVVLLPVVLSHLGGAGLPVAITYFIARSSDRARSIVASISNIAIAQAVALVCLHALMLWPFFKDAPGFVVGAALLTLVQAPLFLGMEYGLAVLQGKQRFGAYNVLRLLPACVYSLSLIPLFVASKASLTTITLAWVLSYLICTGVVAVRVRAELVGRGEEAPEGTQGEVMRFGLKGFLGSVSPLETFRLDQAVVGLFLSPAALGLYVVGLAFTNLPRFIAQSMGAVAYPTIAERTNRASARGVMWRFFYVTAFLCSLTVVALEFALPTLLPFFFGEAFADAIPIARVLLVAGLFLALRRILSDIARGDGRASVGTIGEVSSWIFLLPSLVILAARSDVEGVATALTISSGLSLLVAAWALLFFSTKSDHSTQGRPSLAP